MKRLSLTKPRLSLTKPRLSLSKPRQTLGEEYYFNEKYIRKVKKQARNIQIRYQKGGWWVVNIPDCNDCGPYNRTTANEVRRGLQKTFFNLEDRTYFTTQHRRRKVL